MAKNFYLVLYNEAAIYRKNEPCQVALEEIMDIQLTLYEAMMRYEFQRNNCDNETTEIVDWEEKDET